ncbi:MAG: tetratricopeptide repeat protein [Planctomycetota bacterium]|jgi:tetratricopeptide (TPR) repeat protein
MVDMAGGSSTSWWRMLLGAMITGASAAAPPVPAPVTAGPAAPSPPLPADLERFDAAARRQLEHLAAAVDRRPDDPARWEQLAMACHAYGEHALARDAYEQVLRLDETNARAWYLLAVVRDRLGELPPALAALRRSIELDGARTASRRRMALWLLRDGRLDEAEAAARRAGADDPSVAVVLARIAIQRRDHERAEALLRPIVNAAPDDAYAHFLLGTALRGLGRLEEAMAHLTRGRAGEPAWTDDWLDRVHALRSGDRATLRQAVAALRQVDADAAITLLEPLRARGVDDLDVIVNLARAYRMQGRIDDAIRLLESARGERGDHHVLLFQLAAACQQQAGGPQVSDREEQSLRETALAHVERSIELNAGFAAGHTLRGDVLLELQRPGAAVEAYRQACVLAPDDPRWFVQLGAALCRQGRWADAVPPLEQARDLGSTSPATLHLLSAALANSGQLEAAQSLLEGALRQAPRDTRLRRALERVVAARRADVPEAAGAPQ